MKLWNPLKKDSFCFINPEIEKADEIPMPILMQPEENKNDFLQSKWMIVGRIYLRSQLTIHSILYPECAKNSTKYHKRTPGLQITCLFY